MPTPKPPGPYATRLERVNYLRETQGLGMEKAKRAVWKEDILDDITRAEEIYELKRILMEIVNESY